MTPIKPSEFTAIVPGASTTLAEAIRLVDIKFPALFVQWYSSVFNEDGSFTDAFQQDVCLVKANCGTILPP